LSTSSSMVLFTCTGQLNPFIGSNTNLVIFGVNTFTLTVLGVTFSQCGSSYGVFFVQPQCSHPQKGCSLILNITACTFTDNSTAFNVPSVGVSSFQLSVAQSHFIQGAAGVQLIPSVTDSVIVISFDSCIFNGLSNSVVSIYDEMPIGGSVSLTNSVISNANTSSVISISVVHTAKFPVLLNGVTVLQSTFNNPFVISVGANFTVQDVQITNCGFGVAGFIFQDALATFSNVKISLSTFATSALYLTGSSVYCNYLQVLNCTGGDGTAVSVDAGLFTAVNSQFNSNVARDTGGVFVASSKSMVTLTSCVIQDNTAFTAGVIYCSPDSLMSSINVQFIDNQSQDGTAAIQCSNATSLSSS